MGWAILWGFIVGSMASYDSGGSPEMAGFLAFLVIWHFAHESKRKGVIAEALAKETDRLRSVNEDVEMKLRRYRREEHDYS